MRAQDFYNGPQMIEMDAMTLTATAGRLEITIGEISGPSGSYQLSGLARN